MWWKWAASALLKVIMDVAATTVAKRLDNFFYTSSNLVETCVGNQRIAFAVDKIWTPQDLGVVIKNCRHYVVFKEAEIPAIKSI